MEIIPDKGILNMNTLNMNILNIYKHEYVDVELYWFTSLRLLMIKYIITKY